MADNSPSEASSISAASEGNSSKDVAENQKMSPRVSEEAQETEPEPEPDKVFDSSHHVLLDFMKVSSDDSAHGSKVEHDVLNPGTLASAFKANNEETNENKCKKTSETKVFSCTFCKRVFSSSQSLGGHQNAHRQERALAKRRQGIDVGPYGHPQHIPYYGLSTHPLYGSYNRALGVRMESMIHKPSYAWTSPCYRFGYGAAGWSRQSVLNSPTLNGLRVDGLQAHGSGGYEPVGSSYTSRLEEGGPLGHFGEYSSSAAATNSSSGLNLLALIASGDHQMKQEEATIANDPESSLLDLSLKL